MNVPVIESVLVGFFVPMPTLPLPVARYTLVLAVTTSPKDEVLFANNGPLIVVELLRSVAPLINAFPATVKKCDADDVPIATRPIGSTSARDVLEAFRTSNRFADWSAAPITVNTLDLPLMFCTVRRAIAVLVPIATEPPFLVSMLTRGVLVEDVATLQALAASSTIVVVAKE